MKAETQDFLDSIAVKAAQAAMRSAIEYLKIQEKTENLDIDTLLSNIKKHIHAAHDEAWKDLKLAVENNMHEIGMMTFYASMSQCGIDAAKELQ